ncbi:hypothetical protein CDL12_25702 [Handroanthus impetiginosus]|uniref:RRM domain-containing protein n=1 Tax=Handroanthus impetiginosus TaxID=429701 RepID=A0A2G9G912_9LAMI|nr:hypothetical protein CDL12_25702 [Handroanthus impetiginosus]
MALSHLLQPRSCLQICRLSFQSARRRCRLSVCSNDENDNPPQLKKEAVAEETSGVAAEPFVKESSQKVPNLFSSITNGLAHRGLKKTKTLTDVFREDKDDQTATKAENEETKTEEVLSDVLLNFVKHKNAQFEYPSPSSDSDDDDLEKFPPDRCENDLLEYQNVRHEGEKSPDDQQAAREIVKPRSPILSYQPFEHSNETRSEDAENSFHIQGLVDFLRLHNDVPSKATSKTGLIKDSISNGNSRFGDGEISTLDFNSRDGTELSARMEVSVSPSNKDQKKLKKARIAKKLSEGNKVLVRFLPRSFNESHAFNFFRSCGEILKVEFPYAEGQPLFKVAYIHFKTREGLEEAIKKSGLVISKTIVTVESATSMKTTIKSSIPSLLGDPDVPTALIKNPTRTIRIEQLTHDISSHHIEEALAFCESKVTGYYLGSSHSVAYVEFEVKYLLSGDLFGSSTS